MKRNIIPSTDYAVTWWKANPVCYCQDCFAISLPNGEVIYATDGQWDIALSAAQSPTGAAVTFRSQTYGVWSRGPITSEAGYQLRANTMTLKCLPKLGAMYPGLNIGLLNAAFNHLFDGAKVWVWSVYMPIGQYGTVMVVEPKFQGTITDTPTLDRPVVEFTCSDPTFLLNMKVPTRLVQSNCGWSFGDDPTGANGRCHVTLANYTVPFTADPSSSGYTLVPTSAFTQAVGYFTQGVVTCLTGKNAGLSQTVKKHDSSTSLSMTVPWLLPVAGGDTFSVIKGCDKTPTTCAGLLHADGTAESADWRTRFGGTPFTPPPTMVA